MRILVKALMGENQSVGIRLEDEGRHVGHILLTPEVARYVSDQILAAANEVEAMGGSAEFVTERCKTPNVKAGTS